MRYLRTTAAALILGAMAITAIGCDHYDRHEHGRRWDNDYRRYDRDRHHHDHYADRDRWDRHDGRH